MSKVTSDQRHSKNRPCPVCRGYDDRRLPEGRRCYGFTSDGYVHCTREEFAGGLTRDSANTYAHWITGGECKCGVDHREPWEAYQSNGHGKAPRRPAVKRKGKDAPLGPIVATYDYCDAQGELLFQVVRYEGKDFKQRAPNGKGGWTWYLGGVEKVLYHLPDLLNADPSLPVYIAEGEKDVDRLRSLGYVATCNPGGAEKWLSTFDEPLRGRNVIILADNDDKGRRHATAVAQSCYGKAASVKIVEFPMLPVKGDVSDFLDTHHQCDLDVRVASIPEWESEDADPILRGYKPKTFGVIDKEIGQLEHLWPNMLILGALSMIWSKPKIGKSRLYIGLIHIMWNGLDWPDGTKNTFGPGLKTLVLPYDRNHSEIARDMRAMGIPDEAAVCPHDPRDPTGVSLVALDDPLMGKILQICLKNDPAIKLIVVDTLTYASSKSLSKPEDMKAILDGIMEIAQKFHVAVWVLCHENKEGSALGKRIDERARVLMRLERYNEQDETRLRLFVKEGNFPIKPAVTVIHTDQGVKFEHDAGKTGNAADKQNACARWLVDHLVKLGVGTVIEYGPLINAAGIAGFAGEQNEETGRWSNPNLLKRAIQAINGKVQELNDLHRYSICRDEEERPGRTKPVIRYWIEDSVPF